MAREWASRHPEPASRRDRFTEGGNPERSAIDEFTRRSAAPILRIYLYDPLVRAAGTQNFKLIRKTS